jgi:hypothetical protein
VAKADEEGCIEGLLGAKLRVNLTWSNPTGGPLPAAAAGAAQLPPPPRLRRPSAR